MNTKFVGILKEEVGVAIESHTAAIESTIRKNFPNSFIRCRTSSLGGSTSMFVTFTLGDGSKESYSNGIMENDRAFTRFVIHPARGNDKQYTAEMMQGNLAIRSVRPHMAYDRVKMGWQDVKKASEMTKIIKNMDKYFTNLKKYLDENPDALK
jgi:hypothetical protein